MSDLVVGYVQSENPAIWCHLVFKDEIMEMDPPARGELLLKASSEAKRMIPVPPFADEWPVVGLMTASDAAFRGLKVEPWPTC